MKPGRKGSIRLWQTELFIAVIVVAILVLSGSVSAGLRSTLTRMTETSELRNASALAQRLETELPLGVGGTAPVREAVAEYRDIYGGGIWVYDGQGQLLESAFDSSPTDAELESARLRALDAGSPFVTSDLRSDGWIIAAHPFEGRDGALEGLVVTASPADESVVILNAVRDRMWVAFWVSLIIAGLLGFGFSELITRRIRPMSEAAAAIAAGDFDQRLSPGFTPDEIQDLADSYNSMAERLGETFAAQRRFVADASHEMRTPIAALKGMLELLADGAKEKPEVRDDFIATMQVEVDRLGRLVADLLTLARLEAGSLSLKPAPERVSDLLGDVAGVMRTLAEQAGVGLRVETPDGDLRVMADRDRVLQVLMSFTDNALKHSPRGTSVHLRAIPDGGVVRLEVSDEGAGIEAGEVDHVFERFYRGDSPARDKGTGLGLAIAKEIVEGHGSSIDVRSAPGSGTTFGFELPST